MNENEDGEIKKPSKSRRKRHIEKKQAAEEENINEGGEDRLNRQEDQIPLDVASTSTGISRNLKDDDRTIEPASVAEEPATMVPKKRKKKRKKTAQPTQAEEEYFPPHTILRDVAHLGDDVVEVDGFVPAPAAAHVWHTNICAPPTGKLFVESRGAFKAVDKQKLMASSGGSSPVVREPPSAIEYGLRLRSAVGKAARCCHGLLAGFALWQSVTVYCLGPPRFQLSDFLVHYSPLASSVQALFYALTAVCIVSLMGSIDVGGEIGVLRQYRHVGSGLVALVLYFVALILSLSIADKDDAISLFARNNSSLPGEDDREADIRIWRNVNLCRCLAAISAWLLLAFFPQRDLLKSFLRTLTAETKRGSIPNAVLTTS